MKRSTIAEEPSDATEPFYLSRVQVRRLGGADKGVRLPAEPDEIVMGAHAEVAAKLGFSEREPHPSTLDYLVGATTACLAGTYARALAARGVTLGFDEHEIEGVGEVYDRDGAMVVERIVVTHRLRLAEEHRPTAERVLTFYERGCAVSRSIEGAISISSRVEFV
jgi:organic hydroperoxide reductase OsmC/OhrA